jgi:pyruvate-formate lyase
MQKDFLRAPKFGNDDDFADAWAVKYMKGISDTAGGVKDAWGHPCTFDGSTAAAYQVVGLCCGATPDGRFAMDSFADGTISPMFGTDTCGPTASLNSIAKIPYVFSQLVNQRFAPAFLEGKNKQLFADYIRAWYEKGTISHIQFNIVNDEILRDAQEHPERYTDLQVRVAGYSAFWIDLPKQTQDTIIARSEHVVGGS